MKISYLFLAFTFFIGFVFTNTACQPNEKINVGYVQDDTQIPYALNQPDTAFSLTKKLKEISGLSYDEASGNLIAIEDEKGELFIINKNSGQIIETIQFGEDRDYEGVQRIGSKVYVLESDGDIFTFDMNNRKEESEKFESNLGDDVNIEGLTYHAASKSLLLASKGRGPDQKREDHTRIIYQLPLDTKKKLNEFIRIDLSKNFDDMTSKGLGKGIFFNVIIMQRLRDFSPSGIAVRPSTGELYVLSSRGGLMLVLDKDNYHVKAILFLKRNVHTQPEGICFDREENLYIANEARGRPARLYKFKPSTEVKIIDESKTSLTDLFIKSDSTSNDTIPEKENNK